MNSTKSFIDDTPGMPDMGSTLGAEGMTSLAIDDFSEYSPFVITPSDFIEYLYCPRFIYYERHLMVPQSERRRLKVRLGREMHERRLVNNKDYLRKKAGAVRKELDVPLSSERLGLRGRVDEVLFLEDGSAAPLDYKFAVCPARVFKNHKVQAILYCMMISERYGVTSNRAFLVYIRSNSKLKELKLSNKDFDSIETTLEEMKKVVTAGWFPPPTKSRRRCDDCCYRRICVK